MHIQMNSQFAYECIQSIANSVHFPILQNAVIIITLNLLGQPYLYIKCTLMCMLQGTNTTGSKVTNEPH